MSRPKSTLSAGWERAGATMLAPVTASEAKNLNMYPLRSSRLYMRGGEGTDCPMLADAGGFFELVLSFQLTSVKERPCSQTDVVVRRNPRGEWLQETAVPGQCGGVARQERSGQRLPDVRRQNLHTAHEDAFDIGGWRRHGEGQNLFDIAARHQVD